MDSHRNALAAQCARSAISSERDKLEAHEPEPPWARTSMSSYGHQLAWPRT